MAYDVIVKDSIVTQHDVTKVYKLVSDFNSVKHASDSPKMLPMRVNGLYIMLSKSDIVTRDVT